MSIIDTLIKDHTRQLKAALKLNLLPLPSMSCGCGKPVIFKYPKTTFTCSRCGGKWKLTVSIEQTKN